MANFGGTLLKLHPDQPAHKQTYESRDEPVVSCDRGKCTNLTSVFCNQLVISSPETVPSSLFGDLRINRTARPPMLEYLGFSDFKSSVNLSNVTEQPKHLETMHVNSNCSVLSRDQCQPRDHLVFVKTHKTGSTTLQLILQIYGYYRNLSYLFNAKNMRNGHIRSIRVKVETALPPLSVKAKDYINYFNNFDMSTVHIRYNRSYLNSMMKNGTKYISILRDPVTHFESAFVFFGHFKNTGKPVEQQIKEWFQKPHKDANSLRNKQIIDLGFDGKKTLSKKVVERYIKQLSQDFDLVLITEYFDESLLLLRKLMCWNFFDILYIKQNARPKSKRALLSEPIKKNIRNWSEADVKLYQHFNETFWKRIDQYGPNLSRDLKLFREMQSRVYEFCVSGAVSQKKGSFYRTKYKVKMNSTEYCTLMVNADKNVFHRLWKRQK